MGRSRIEKIRNFSGGVNEDGKFGQFWAKLVLQESEPYLNNGVEQLQVLLKTKNLGSRHVVDLQNVLIDAEAMQDEAKDRLGKEKAKEILDQKDK